MANQVSLLSYFEVALPAIPINPPPRSGPNTQNDAYSHRDIRAIGVWEDFNLANIIQTYGPALTTPFLPAEQLSTSPPRAISSENALRQRIGERVSPRIRRSLFSGFGHLAAMNQMNGLTSASFDPNWKWSTAMATGGTRARQEYRQALSQVNWHMKQHHRKYSFVLTDKELVALYRPIPWETGGTAASPQPTVPLALWYIGMLATQD
ncbi:hypothetical protein BDV26DRAFT_278901 [Aspergillus bertholletiae]|uniref:Uncharacterized protein n=1 Tax=Aspergillus bertholletiae TaxID=1226010 RepID=A0A5N7BHS9_9EURO|nr:hypothetical protein BDV26DRAFT_278901 [Aspergillus bertholletiae]